MGEEIAEVTLTRDNLNRIRGELFDYARYHFSEEEQLMSSEGLDPRHITAHQKIHRQFLQDVARLADEITDPGSEEAEHLLEYLVSWLAFHILGEDQNMARQTKAVRAGNSASAAFDKHEQSRDTGREPLVQALHQLFEQVMARNRKLAEVNDHLEELVAARTR